MKANRALEGLIRSFQIATPRGHFNTSAVLTSYFACERSVLEFCSVIWGGAAAVHTDRVNRVQHRFLMWLNVHSRSPSTSMSYADLLKHFKLCSLAARRTQHDILFARNVLIGTSGSRGGGAPRPWPPPNAKFARPNYVLASPKPASGFT